MDNHPPPSKRLWDTILASLSESSPHETPYQGQVSQVQYIVFHGFYYHISHMFSLLLVRPKEEVTRTAPQSFASFQLLRCGKCCMCARDECGKCTACVANVRQTSTSRAVCVRQVSSSGQLAESILSLSVPVTQKFSLQVCARIPEEDKLLPLFISNSPDPVLHFFFGRQKEMCSLSEWEDPGQLFDDIVFVTSSGRKHRSLKKALYESQMVQHIGKVATSLAQQTGFDAYVEPSHYLIGKGYHLEWRDVHGCSKEVYGKITKCYRGIADDAPVFSIEICESTWIQLKHGSLLEEPVPQILENVVEEDAWGGHVSHLTATNSSMPHHVPFFVRRYFVPRTRVVEGEGLDGIKAVRVLFRGFEISLFAGKSSIVNAGLGLWASCKLIDSSITSATEFVLKPGEMLDLGIYGPLLPEDFRHDHISLLKNYIHQWAPEGWNFDSVRGCNGVADVIDITDDRTGDLHSTAKANPLVYTNEVDGNKHASILPQEDPEGAIHYYLGPYSSNHKPLRMPADGKTQIELFVDYGPLYETVRERQGYSRLSGTELVALRKVNFEKNAAVVEELRDASANEINGCLNFIHSIFRHQRCRVLAESEAFPVLQKSMTATLVLRSRLQQLKNEFSGFNSSKSDNLFCDNGYTDLIQTGKLEKRANDLTSSLASLFPTQDKKKWWNGGLFSVSALSDASVKRCLGLSGTCELSDLVKSASSLL